MTDLLAYTPPLKLHTCCAKPQNSVRKAELEDIRQWLQERHICLFCWEPMDNDLTCHCTNDE